MRIRRILSFPFVVALLLCPAICVFGSGNGLATTYKNDQISNNLTTIGLVIIVAVAFVIYIMFKKTNKPTEPSAKPPLEMLLGGPPRFGYVYYYDNYYESGIGISSDLKTIGLFVHKTQKAYPVDKIRGHRISNVLPDIVLPGIVAGSSFNAVLTQVKLDRRVSNENKRLSDQAAAQSGLFIQVKDIDYPEWRIYMDPENQKVWDEILTQLYDGTLS